MLGICKKGSIVFSLKLFPTCEQVELFTTHAHTHIQKNKKIITQQYLLRGERDLKFRNVGVYLIL